MESWWMTGYILSRDSLKQSSSEKTTKKKQAGFSHRTLEALENQRDQLIYKVWERGGAE